MLSYVAFFARCTLMLVFGAAIISKTHSAPAWSAFVTATRSLLGVNRLAVVWAAAAALLEATTLACLLIAPKAYAGFAIAVATLTIFCLLIVRSFQHGAATKCNCFGSNGAPLSWSHVARNGLLIGVAAMGTGAAAELGQLPFSRVDATYSIPIVLSILSAALLVLWDDMSYLIAGSPQ